MSVALTKDDIFEVIKSNDCIVFIGSGLSSTIYPNWNKTVDKLCEACGVPKPESSEPYKLLAKVDECRKSNIERYKDTMLEIFGKPVVDIPPAYYLLFKLPFRAYITFNFDPLLWTAAIDQRRQRPSLYIYPGELPVPGLRSSDKKPIYYIHGMVNPKDPSIIDNLVFSNETFEKAYKEDSPLHSFITQVLLYCPTIFIGYSFSEPLTRETFRRVHRIWSNLETSYPVEKQRKLFALLAYRYKNNKRDKEFEETENKRWNEVGINVVRYDPIDKNHSGVEKFLDNLLEKLETDEEEEILYGSK